MSEKLVPFNAKDLLDKCARLIMEESLLPSDCPNPYCISLAKIDIEPQWATTIRIDTNPPQLPTEKEGLRFEIDPICKNKCRIFGNANRCFVVRQNNITNEITAEADWKGNL
jgi:hypothetical protein